MTPKTQTNICPHALSTLQLTDDFIAFKLEKDTFQQRGFVSTNADEHTYMDQHTHACTCTHVHTEQKLEEMKLRYWL